MVPNLDVSGGEKLHAIQDTLNSIRIVLSDFHQTERTPPRVQVASTVVDILNRFYPQHMDRLEREKAFFPGPGPLLMSSLTLDDLAILLSGSDRKASQVGALRCMTHRDVQCLGLPESRCGNLKFMPQTASPWKDMFQERAGLVSEILSFAGIKNPVYNVSRFPFYHC